MASGNFILLDAARMNEAMEEAKALNPSHESLYKSTEDEMLQSVAPYLFEFEHGNEFSNYFLEKGWGDSWGVLLSSRADFKEIHKHFRRFLLVKTEDGLQLYFRFYDPRVLRIFLPTCDSNQLEEFFGPIQFFLVEDEDSRYGIKFWLERGILQNRKLHFREMFIKENKEEHIAVVSPPVPASREDDLLVIPKTQHVEKNKANTTPNVPKPNKPKWNMLD